MSALGRPETSSRDGLLHFDQQECPGANAQRHQPVAEFQGSGTEPPVHEGGVDKHQCNPVNRPTASPATRLASSRSRRRLDSCRYRLLNR